MTVAPNALPAVWGEPAPVEICSDTAADGATVTFALPVIPPSAAVTFCGPAVFNVVANVFEPLSAPMNVSDAGRTA